MILSDKTIMKMIQEKTLSITPLEKEQIQRKKELQKAIPMEKWSDAHHWLIWHGRKICKARKPLCSDCMLTELCPYKEKNFAK